MQGDARQSKPFQSAVYPRTKNPVGKFPVHGFLSILPLFNRKHTGEQPCEMALFPDTERAYARRFLSSLGASCRINYDRKCSLSTGSAARVSCVWFHASREKLPWWRDRSTTTSEVGDKRRNNLGDLPCEAEPALSCAAVNDGIDNSPPQLRHLPYIMYIARRNQLNGKQSSKVEGMSSRHGSRNIHRTFHLRTLQRDRGMMHSEHQHSAHANVNLRARPARV